MKIEIDIPRNDYVQPTEIRPHMVERVCKVMLSGEEVAPFSSKRNREGSLYVLWDSVMKKDRLSPTFEYQNGECRVRTVELQAAFEQLIRKGYNLFVKRFETGPMWICSKKPFVYGWETANSCDVPFID